MQMLVRSLCSVRARECIVYPKYRVSEDRGSPFSNSAPSFLCAEVAAAHWGSTISSSRCVCVLSLRSPVFTS